MIYGNTRIPLFPNARTDLGYGPFHNRCIQYECELTVADESLSSNLCLQHLREAWASFEIYAADHPEEAWPNAIEPRRRDVTSVDAHGTVYFARVGELIKIGWTSNLSPRMSHLHADAVLFTRPGTRHDEKALHAMFNHLLVRGREWFRPDPELLAFIAELH